MQNKDGELLSCPKCGEKASATAKFCSKCGGSLALSTAAPKGGKRERPRKKEFDVLGLASAGFFFFFLGAVYLSVPNLYEAVRLFILDFYMKEVSTQPSVVLPVPTSNHPIVYGAVETFCFLYGSAQIAILILRFAIKSPLRLKAQTLSGIIFWMGAGYAVGLLKTQTIGWFTFWTGIIIIAGASLIIRAIINLALSQES
jgi:hypothetical protein